MGASKEIKFFPTYLLGLNTYFQNINGVKWILPLIFFGIKTLQLPEY